MPRPQVSPSLLLLHEGWCYSEFPAALRTLHEACKNLRPLCIFCQHLWQFLALAITVAYARPMVIAPERSRFPVFDPADGSIIETVDSASPEDGIAAVDAAARAASDWASRAPRERAEILRRAFDLMTSRLDEIAGLIVREMGKPFVEARGEASYAAEFLRWFSEEVARAHGEFALERSEG